MRLMFGILCSTLIFALTSCDENNTEKVDHGEYCQHIFDAISGLETVWKDGYEELEIEVAAAYANDDGKSDSTRLHVLLERHEIRLDALLQIRIELDSLFVPENSHARDKLDSLAHECLDVQGTLFPAMYSYLENGVGELEKLKVSPFVQLTIEKARITQELKTLQFEFAVEAIKLGCVQN